jgi:hypothetical protein
MLSPQDEQTVPSIARTIDIGSMREHSSPNATYSLTVEPAPFAANSRNLRELIHVRDWAHLGSRAAQEEDDGNRDHLGQALRAGGRRSHRAVGVREEGGEEVRGTELASSAGSRI